MVQANPVANKQVCQTQKQWAGKKSSKKLNISGCLAIADVLLRFAFMSREGIFLVADSRCQDRKDNNGEGYTYKVIPIIKPF